MTDTRSRHVRMVYQHDFNIPSNEGGFHEVVLPSHMTAPALGEEVIVKDPEGFRLLGRVRAIVLVVEEVEWLDD
jgi:hypothetical protein